MFYFCTKTDRERATICFALVPLVICGLVLSLLLTNLTLEANASVRAIQEFEKAAFILSIYFSFICMLDLILFGLIITLLGNGIWHCHQSFQEEDY